MLKWREYYIVLTLGPLDTMDHGEMAFFYAPISSKN